MRYGSLLFAVLAFTAGAMEKPASTGVFVDFTSADPGYVISTGRAFANGGAVVVQDVPGYNSWPMIQSVRDDRLVCVYSRGKVHEIDEGGRGAYARVSSDGGRTWSAEVCVANDLVFCKVPIGKGRSPDGGAFFWIRCYGGSNPRHDLYKTMDGIRFSRVATPSFSPLPMQITDIFSVGSELVALWFAGDYSDKPVHSWGMLVSDDDGKSWRQRTVEQGLFQKDWPTEPSVANLGNGRLLAIARTECDGPQFQLGCVRFRGFKGGYKLTWRDSAGWRHVIYGEVR